MAFSKPNYLPKSPTFKYHHIAGDRVRVSTYEYGGDTNMQFITDALSHLSLPPPYYYTHYADEETEASVTCLRKS